MTMKCGICEEVLGLKNKTGLCSNCRVKKWHKEHKGRVNEIKRTYVRLHPKKRAETIKKYRSRNREKMNVWAILEYHVLKGHIPRPDKCTECSKKGLLHAHHANYLKPL